MNYQDQLFDPNDDDDDDEILDKILKAAVPIIINEYEDKKKGKKRCWESAFVRNRPIGFHAVNFQTILKDEKRFHNYFRMKPTQFQYILDLIAPLIHRQTVTRKPISPQERLCVTLRYLASGDSQISIASQYNLGTSTVCEIISTTCEALWSQLQPLVLPTPTTDDFKKIAAGFEKYWNFPHCIGAIDGRHIHIQAPANSGSEFYNYKSFHSIVLLAICDHKYSFTLVDIGANGRQSDGGIFSRSPMGKKFNDGSMGVPEPSLVTGSDSTVLPYVLVGDQAFSASSYLIRPYPEQYGMDINKKIFNYRLSRARRMIENTFGVWSSRWRILRKPIIAKRETVESIVKSTVCLHNYLVQNNDNNNNNNSGNNCRDNFIDNEFGTELWREEAAALNEQHEDAEENLSSVTGNKIRDQFTEFFEHEGAVKWQFDRIHQ